jgi:hypothetical protein
MTAGLHQSLGSLKYSPLPTTSGLIRLLELLPGPLEAFLECKLIEISLYSQPSYKALSYAWVDERTLLNDREVEQDYLVCNQRVVLIPKKSAFGAAQFPKHLLDLETVG